MKEKPNYNRGGKRTLILNSGGSADTCVKHKTDSGKRSTDSNSYSSNGEKYRLTEKLKSCYVVTSFT